jgi:hypothetical protein
MSASVKNWPRRALHRARFRSNVRGMKYGTLGGASAFFAGAALALSATACGSSDDTNGGGGEDSYLSKDARDELAQVDALKYEGTAVATEELAQDGGFTRVTYDPASGPMCLRGGAFTAFYADRGSDKTMIILNGGGACWTALCAATEVADQTVTTIGPAAEKTGEPYGDWNVIVASYCDGSVFSGDNDFTQTDGTVRHHHGIQNLAATLDIAKEHFGTSKQVMVAGFSAGGYGTIPGMVATRLLFPKADLFVMDDSGPGLQNLDNPEGIQQRLDEWQFQKTIPDSCTDCQKGKGQLTPMFSWMLQRDTNMKVSLMSYYEDGVIGVFFLGLQGPDYKKLLTTETGKVQSAYPDRFKRYMLPGSSHVVSAGWSTVTADGVKLSDWGEGMISGAAVWTDHLAPE